LRVAQKLKNSQNPHMQKSFPLRPQPQGGLKLSLAIVASEFNRGFVQGLVDNALHEIQEIHPDYRADTFWCPGSFEIPVFAQSAAESLRYDAIIALGVIIEGETAHAHLIAESVTHALMGISLKNKLPVIHEVLLVKNELQAKARCLEAAHNRGIESARAAIMAATNLKKIY
jgi:6,7-dimethyl-8-ribityllumazine synthase